MQSEVIVLQVLHPPALPHIEVPLGKDVFQTFVVRKHLELLTIQVVAPFLQGKDNGRQLQIMRTVILLVIL